MTKEEFIINLKELNINPTEDQLNKLEIYKNMLIEYNQKFNLTAITKEEEIYLKHFYDSLTIIKVIDLTPNLKLLDIGTGAGFPGLVLKIFFPNLDITLLDSNNKKIMFLNEVIAKLKLTNITAFHGRAEELITKYREYFDIVTSRAVADLRILVELSIPYVKPQGYFIALKGRLSNEIDDSKKIIDILNSKIVDIITFTLPDNINYRTIIKIKKISPTPTKYPRKYDQIIKQKLK